MDLAQHQVCSTRLAGEKADNWWFRHHPKVLGFKFKKEAKRPDKANAIDLYVTDQIDDRASWESLFETVPEPLTPEERKAWKAEMKNFVLSSDAFFPFPDNVQRAAQSGVSFVAAPSGSVMDEAVVREADEKGIGYIFTKWRLFHH